MTRALIGIIGLLLLDWVFASAASASDSAVKMQAVIVLVSLLWDAATSGSITNHSGENFPRHTRVAVFGAYVLAVAGAVMLLRDIHLAGVG
jgi:hypothetical protein